MDCPRTRFASTINSACSLLAVQLQFIYRSSLEVTHLRSLPNCYPSVCVVLHANMTKTFC